MRTPTPIRKLKEAWTLVEVLVVVVIVAILMAILYPAISNSKRTSNERNAEANARTLNDAILRARLKGDTNALIGSNASDVNAAAQYLKDQGYLQ